MGYNQNEGIVTHTHQCWHGTSNHDRILAMTVGNARFLEQVEGTLNGYIFKLTLKKDKKKSIFNTRLLYII